MKCNRCRSTLYLKDDGWAKCPKCGLGKFIGIPKSKSQLKREAELKKEQSPTPEEEEKVEPEEEITPDVS